MSDETQKVVDEEIYRIVDEGYDYARKLIEQNIDKLHIIAKGLLEYETLSGKEIQDLLEGKPPIREFEAAQSSAETRKRASAVPSAGRKKPKGGEEPGTGGLEPQPQS